MYINDKMKNAVLTVQNLDELRKISIENGMTPLFNSCKSLVEKGVTSIQELMSLNTE